MHAKDIHRFPFVWSSIQSLQFLQVQQLVKACGNIEERKKRYMTNKNSVAEVLIGKEQL